ncbi:Low-affinity iron/zinc ion transport protein fet4 [Escovopsis weberi]|uniref:Low-affinity iron/zinc ion transport protein fet4 n=1 Tax=Escovopsis weberi TaxID=150374 RepID=A0A0M8N071_ESCWE|nr:Low-affinity iron/zinc ion transport protein fet4 [Escovopsis weberi]
MFLRKIAEYLATPGAKGAVNDTAHTQVVPQPNLSLIEQQEGKDVSLHVLVQQAPEKATANITGYVEHAKANRLDRWLDQVVKASGSQPVFLMMVGGVLAWAFLGIPYGESDQWAALISDVQAIISYAFDSLLMRQQLNRYERQIHVSAQLRSRIASQRRMLREIHGSGKYKKGSVEQIINARPSKFGADLPAEGWTSRISNYAAAFLGHFATVCMYWVCIVIWLGFGDSQGWSDRWQLNINSATSALMILIFTFLANIHERHDDYVEECLDAIFQVDSDVEVKLRTMTGDTMPNPTITVPGPQLTRTQRVIFYYADVIGTLVGIALLIIVLVVWVCIGPAMHWNNNWWLLIGTYAGLVGLIDGFVLRNVQARLHEYEVAALDQVKLDDVGIFDEIGVPEPEKTHMLDYCSLNYRLSTRMGTVCAHEITVMAGIVLVIGLIVGASAMKWTTTGQLLCNIPPSIVESFFMMILITGHNLSEAEWRTDLHNMYLGRLRLLAYVDHLEEE